MALSVSPRIVSHAKSRTFGKHFAFIRWIVVAATVAVPSTGSSEDQALGSAMQSNGGPEPSPYIDEPFERLINDIPKLKGIEPATDQHALAVILSATAERVDRFLRDIVTVAAQEEVTQEKLDKQGSVLSSQHLQYNYLILLHKDETPQRLEEYRQGASGQIASQKSGVAGYSVTSGFALKCLYFATPRLKESRFRYLGEQLVGATETYVVGFAQQPGKASSLESVSGDWGSTAILVQGIAWIDQHSLQIIHLRTDLLVVPTGVGLDRQTTEIAFGEIKLPDVEAPLWLPTEVDVQALFRGENFRNEHRYSNYKHFGATVKMIAP
jgi:hypothetical protein